MAVDEDEGEEERTKKKDGSLVTTFARREAIRSTFQQHKLCFRETSGPYRKKYRERFKLLREEANCG